MFHLLKILNGRTGVPEPSRIALTSAATVKYGTPVIISNGTLTKMSASSTALPTHLVLADSEGKEILATPIFPEMVFEVPLGAAATTLVEGKEYLVASDGLSLSATAADSSKRGAKLVSANGAKAAGDTVTVRFAN